MRGGDIATVNLEEDALQPEVVGSFESGVLSAAWSPDDSLVALATADDKLILMTSTFDVVFEGPLHPGDFGEDAPINVGWGSKQTQFHGSLGKAAAQEKRPDIIGSSPDDDGLPRVSWRGDGAFFTISSLTPARDGRLRRRQLRVYSLAGALQSTSEDTPGLEHVLSWRPSGNWIVSTQRYGFEGGGIGREGRHDLVMFERNGLRRGEFSLEKVASGHERNVDSVRQWGYRVCELGWSSDSNILSVWIERAEGDIVQLWTIGNYHWYLKHEIPASSDDDKPQRFTSVSWHPEDPLKILLTTSTSLIQRTYAWETFVSRSKPPVDSGSVAVLDGASILLTPFRTQNAPPPMSSHSLTIPNRGSPASYDFRTKPLPPTHISFFSHKDLMLSLWESGYHEMTELMTRLGPGKGKIMEPVTRCFAPQPDWKGWISKQALSIDSDGSFALLQSSESRDRVVFVTPSVRVEDTSRHAAMPGLNGRLVYGDGHVAWQSPDGEIFPIDIHSGDKVLSGSFSEFCFESQRVEVSSATPDATSRSFFVGLSQGGKLYVAHGTSSRLLASNVNSFTVASGFLVYTTTAHVAQFAPLNALSSLLANLDATAPLPEWETRRVERGSRIVTAVPSTMSLVLQMPRGNLETINPRPLVMNIVRQDIDQGNFAKAFSACRRHRVDLNVFLEHDKAAFLRNIPQFIEQVSDVDYINLFLTSVGQGSLPSDVVAETCDAIRMELERIDLKKYVSTILTAHVVKRPPDHEAGLSLLLRLRDTEPQLVEDAVKYIIFLVDADRLFDTALGMYDFSLVLMIAQHAQKDPREYLPFLRELRALDEHYQKFRIDDHLKRHEKALRHLADAGVERFEEATAYAERHQLYDSALAIWRDTAQYEAIMNIYGDWLFERRDFRDAAFVFRQANKPTKAMIAYEKALDWQEVFEIAVQEQLAAEELSDIGYRIAEDLSAKKRYHDASRVFLDYVKNPRAAIIALVQGNLFSEARRVIALHTLPELLEEIVYPGALDTRAQIAEEIGEMKDQLRKQVERLKELRIKKVEEPDSFYGVEDTDLHNVDVMTDISMAPTMFTRYTQAPTTASRTSKRSSRSKRKMERKVGSGRKGTVDEEEYLLKSITKLVARFSNSQNDAHNLLPHLLQFTQEHKDEAIELQDEISSFEKKLLEAVEEIWKKPVEVDGEAQTADSWAVRMQEHDKRQAVDPMEKVTKPEITKRVWNAKLSSLR
ncbi:hypothetical protein EIP91_007007 [Steccherinum ochraceum]|uniref:Elongator complex protein 1 n=1 Tax=Steccherinum ochraceum TaxID=92696 RepID=A0A4R0RT79_9APHY|nr:hypothetical protein EIP91_007007 [Steccherinum ochraceum]